jgi:hypothetical protein
VSFCSEKLNLYSGLLIIKVVVYITNLHLFKLISLSYPKIGFEKTSSNQPQIVRSLSLPHLSSALAGAAMTNLALAEPFIASDAAVVFWSFSTTGKGLSPPRL